ncbi:hypothetical protein CBF45_00250 [Bordetella sp. J329]|jgi:DNA-binding transcriptional MerR regulator|uniref:MerR family transcriptional regulator n=1 Tax=Kerstersia gyiorum TaxID=206506 RepID=UPI000FD9FFF8|nr:MerR family DNA-binding transcriptional regulator [Kerstersia gyiorum]AZV92346.1 hypothetical protein CBF45_00250 [Bordetella sp. J329]MCH4270308.1 MerR family DNA-binding transcriptional regulator [Kerstersia gyiorum]MCI1230465.1 MerR family DNA-binding transcriptional regulator [Kerstersia gyiorum]
MPAPNWSISELSSEFGITPRTLRFYEDKGILAPARHGRHRIYGARDRARLVLTLRARAVGLALDDIRGLLDIYTGPDSTQAQIRACANKLEIHRQFLLSQRQEIDLMLARVEEQIQDCLNKLDPED